MVQDYHSGDQFRDAWNRLCNAFGSQAMLTRQAMSILLNIKPLNSSTNVKYIRDFSNDLNSSTSILTHQGVNILQSSGEQSAILAGIETKLPHYILLKWIENKIIIEDASEIPSLNDCIGALENYLFVQEKLAFIKGEKTNVGGTGRKQDDGKVHATNPEPIQTPLMKCIFCSKEGHTGRTCRCLLTEQEKRNIISKTDSCWNCLDNKHSIRQCTQQRVCFKCRSAGKNFFNHHWNTHKRSLESDDSRENVAPKQPHPPLQHQKRQ